MARPDSFGPPRSREKSRSGRTSRAGDHFGERVGRYRLLGELGHGGMAFLYLARAEGPAGFGRLVAIKVLHPHLARSREVVEMFLAEARTAARIHHPNVVPVHEVGEEDGQYFIVMDYVSGENLAYLLERTWGDNKSFPIPVAAHILAGAADGLHAAHELKDRRGQPLNVVHRDVSPQNMLVGFDGVARVLDFGIAKAADRDSTTRPGALKGKLDFMAPEQVLGKSLDRRCDIFALGVVLWESTTGRRLFRDSSEMLTARRILEMPVPPPSALIPSYPKKLEAAVLKALAKNREDRFETAKDFAAALREVLHDEAPNLGQTDVEAFMRELAPDRFERRQLLERRATLDRDSNLGDELAGSLLSDLGAVREALADLGGSPQRTKRDTDSGETAPRPARRSRAMLALAAAAVGVGVAASWYVFPGHPEEPPSPPRPPETAPTGPAEKIGTPTKTATTPELAREAPAVTPQVPDRAAPPPEQRSAPTKVRPKPDRSVRPAVNPTPKTKPGDKVPPKPPPDGKRSTNDDDLFESDEL